MLRRIGVVLSGCLPVGSLIGESRHIRLKRCVTAWMLLGFVSLS